jgi:LPS export ABC transporter protein LptC
MRAPSVKLMRRVLLGIIILTLASVLVNYVQTWRHRSRQVSRAPQILDAAMKRSAKEVEYVEYRGTPRVPKFKIHAQFAHEKQTGQNLLEGIEACDFNPDGTIRNEIHSLRAEYDPVRKIADFAGDVRLFINRKIELRTDSLHYDLDSEVGTTPDLMRFFSEQISGTARGIRFEQKHRSLELLSQVDLNIVREDKKKGGAGKDRRVHATAQRAYCSETAGRILFEGNARLVSDMQVLSGEHIEALLDSEHKRIRSLTAEGNALYRQDMPDEARSLSGERLVFGIRDGALQNISVSGQAEFFTASPSETQNLRGREIDVNFDAKELPTQIKARGSVIYLSDRGADQIRMSGDQLDAAFITGTKILQSIQILKPDKAPSGMPVEQTLLKMGTTHGDGSELQADDIRVSLRERNGRSAVEKLRAEGTARYVSKPARKDANLEPVRSLSASLLEMTQSKTGDYFESGSASGNVVFLEESNGPASRPQLRKMIADRARFQFYPDSNALKHLDADGNVQLAYEKSGSAKSDAIEKFLTSSENMKAEFAVQAGKSTVESVLQWGHFRYEDGLRNASSGRCEYDAGKQLLVLTDFPQITDSEKSTTGDRVEYDQGGKILSVHGKVRSEFHSRKGPGSLFAPESASSSGIVKADEMHYWTDSGRARYTGNVHLLSDNQNLQTDTLEISNGMEQVVAQGKVRHLISRRESGGSSTSSGKKSGQAAPDILTLIQSSTMSYLKDINRISYSGKVTMHSADADLSSDDLDAIPDSEGKKIQQATARGNVVVQYGARSCKGDVADYFLDSKKFIVTGKPAEFNDPAKGRSYARRLTSTTADDTILLEK